MAALRTATRSLSPNRLLLAGAVAGGVLATTPVARWMRTEVYDPETEWANVLYALGGASATFVAAELSGVFILNAVAFGMLVAAVLNAKQTATS